MRREGFTRVVQKQGCHSRESGNPILRSSRRMTICMSRGFTLVEMLVTLSMLALVGMTAVAILSGGLRVWERLQNQETVGQQVSLALESVRREIHNAQLFRPIPFKGEYDSFSFPALVERVLEDGTVLQEVGRVGFFLDEGRNQLCRSRLPYRLLRGILLRENRAPLVGGIQRLRFSYYGEDLSTGDFAWKDSWFFEEPPLAVKMELGYRETPKGKILTRLLIVGLPVGWVPEPGQKGSP